MPGRGAIAAALPPLLLCLTAAPMPSLAPESAMASATDVTATHAFVVANDALVRASAAKTATARRRIRSFELRIRQECPGVGVGSHHDDATQQLNYEAAGALSSIVYGTAAGTIARFFHTVRRLRWSERKLTDAVRSYARSLHELATLPLPNLCGDVRAWSASGFQTVPPTTSRFVRRLEATEGQTIPWRALARYELPQDRSIVRQTGRLETKLRHIETTEGSDEWEALLRTLGLDR